MTKEKEKIGKIKWIVYFLVVILIIDLIGFLSLWQINKIAEPLQNDIPKGLEEIAASSHLNSLAQFIRYYDEVLTQSARNYAFTSDIKWKERYNAIVPELDDIIKEAILEGDEQDSQFFENVDIANLALVEMEERSIALVDEGRAPLAIIILESAQYWEQKAIYEKGLVDYVSRKGFRYDETLEASTDIIQAASQKVKDVLETNKKIIIILIISVVGIAMILVVTIAITLWKRKKEKLD